MKKENPFFGAKDLLPQSNTHPKFDDAHCYITHSFFPLHISQKKRTIKLFEKWEKKQFATMVYKIELYLKSGKIQSFWLKYANRPNNKKNARSEMSFGFPNFWQPDDKWYRWEKTSINVSNIQSIDVTAYLINQFLIEANQDSIIATGNQIKFYA